MAALPIVLLAVDGDVDAEGVVGGTKVSLQVVPAALRCAPRPGRWTLA